MTKQEYFSSIYEPVQHKTFKSSLNNFLLKEFPQIGGPMIIDLMVNRIESMVDTFYPPLKNLKLGQFLWFAVAKDEKLCYGKTMAKTRIVPTILSLVTDDEIEKMKQGISLKEMRKVRKARLLKQAEHQEGILSSIDLSLISLESLHTISRHVTRYEKEQKTILPRRGTIHDMGSSLSHKGIICKKRKAERKSISEVARETNHSPQAIDRYTQDLDRVSLCLKKGLSINDTSFVTNLGKNLVVEYRTLSNEIEVAKKENLFDLNKLPF